MKHRILILFSALFVLVFAHAQETITVSGKVTDAVTNEELIGVAIQVDGAKGVGTITDFEGNFKLDKLSPNAVLSVSYIGFKTTQVNVNGQTQLQIALESSVTELDEFVVVGYTTQKKRDVLGALNKVNGKDLAIVPVASADQALQGRVSGVQVSSATGAPGGGTSVRVRGVSSIQLSNEPLYIIDGVQIEGGLNSISPSDIENITVLKDASTTAIYGSRGANGIVLITTKSGQKGNAKISYNGQYGIQKASNIIDMVNTNDYITLYNEAARTDNAMLNSVKRPLLEGDYLDGLANVNHLKSIFRTARIQSHELSVSGGGEKSTYRVSGSIFDQEGIIKGSDYIKGNVRANLKSEVKSWLTTDFSITGSVSKTNSVPSSGDGFQNSEGPSVVRYAMFRNPGIPIYNADGNFVDLPSEYFGDPIYNTFLSDGRNPIGQIANQEKKREEKDMVMSGAFTIKLPLNIVSKTVLGFDYKNGEYRTMNKQWGTNGNIDNPTTLNVERYDRYAWTANTILTHAITLGEKHNLSSMVGTEALRTNSKALSASDQHFADDNIVIGNGGKKENRSMGESMNAFTLASFFGSVNYNYDHKYYLAATVRHDGTSRFVGKNKWGTFYSISGGWNIDSEEFMKDVKFVDILKLRAGYGTVGNQNTSDYYPYSNRISPDYNYPFGDKSQQGYGQSKLGNPDLKWETNKQLNVGVDVAFLKNSLGFTVDYYRRKSIDMIMRATVPPSVGYVTPSDVNNGTMLNTGIDFEVFYRKDYKDAGFHVALNAGYLKNKVLEIDQMMSFGRVDTGIDATRLQNGYPVGSFFMYEMDGIFQNMTEVLTSPYQGANIQPGDVKYVDQNGDNIIDDKDRKHLGSAIPKFTTGLNLSGYWKNFDASCFFQGEFGHKNYIQVFHDIEGFYRGFGVTQRYFDNRWTGEGSTNKHPRASWAMKENNVKVSSRFLEDASYLRLKNIQVGYTVPNVKRLGLESLRFYVSASNLFTITKYPGMDPEMTVSANAQGEGDAAKGIDWGTYPNAKSYTVGLNLTF